MNKVQKIANSSLDLIGNTPMVRLNNIPKEYNIECEMVVKCEFYNPGGSIKDRIAKAMIDNAEKIGQLKPNDTLIEPTSGNTGIGLALCSAIKGYKTIITLPEKMSQEKVNVLKALGADIIRSKNEEPWDSPNSHIGIAKQLNQKIPNSHILDQYKNPYNPIAHYEGTAQEILFQCDNKLDMIVISAGTGGTVSGVGKKIKEVLPNCKVIGVDPIGSILAEPETLNDYNRLKGYQVEGIGYDFIPDVLDRSIVDEWVKTSDKDSFLMAKKLICKEGLLCGGSCGASMWAAIQMAKKYNLDKNKRIVVILPDSVRNYVNKFIVDEWMEEKNLL